MSGRQRFEKRVAPEMDRVLERGESVVASGYAMTMASRGAHALFGAGAAFMSKHYWLALTDRRLIVLRMEQVGTRPVFERAEPLSEVHVHKRKPGLLGVRLELDVADVRYRFRFPLTFKPVAQAIAATLAA